MKIRVTKKFILDNIPRVIENIEKERIKRIKEAEINLFDYIDSFVGSYKLGIWPFKKPILSREQAKKYLQSSGFFGIEDLNYDTYKYQIECAKWKYKSFQSQLNSILIAAKNDYSLEFLIDGAEFSVIIGWL